MEAQVPTCALMLFSRKACDVVSPLWWISDSPPWSGVVSCSSSMSQVEPIKLSSAQPCWWKLWRGRKILFSLLRFFLWMMPAVWGRSSTFVLDLPGRNVFWWTSWDFPKTWPHHKRAGKPVVSSFKITILVELQALTESCIGRYRQKKFLFWKWPNVCQAFKEKDDTSSSWPLQSAIARIFHPEEVSQLPWLVSRDRIFHFQYWVMRLLAQ